MLPSGQRNCTPLLCGFICRSDQPQRLPAIKPVCQRLAIFADGRNKLLPLARPGTVIAVVFDQLLGGGAERCCAVSNHQAFPTVMSAQAFDDQVTLLAKNLEREKVLPLRPTGVQAGHLPIGCAQGTERVVFHRRVPERASQHRKHLAEFTEKPAKQIQSVNALVEQLAAATLSAVGAPLLLIAGAPAVAVAAAEKYQPADAAGSSQRVRFPQRRVVSVIEAGFELRAIARRGRNQAFRLPRGDCQRLFAQYVLTRFECYKA